MSVESVVLRFILEGGVVLYSFLKFACVKNKLDVFSWTVGDKEKELQIYQIQVTIFFTMQF